jgi:dolichyl-phosphate-mannose--protein O-mannosyl transferase
MFITPQNTHILRHVHYPQKTRTHTHTHTYTYSRGKNPVSCATLSVRGSTMRTWILPESLNLDALLVDDTAAAKKKKQAAAATANASSSRPMGRGGGGGRGRGRGRR